MKPLDYHKSYCSVLKHKTLLWIINLTERIQSTSYMNTGGTPCNERSKNLFLMTSNYYMYLSHTFKLMNYIHNVTRLSILRVTQNFLSSFHFQKRMKCLRMSHTL